jgi:hypothetical protein
MSARRRPVVVFDEEHADDRELFWSAYKQRSRADDGWVDSVDLEAWARNAVQAADPNGHLSGLSPHAAIQSTVARWTDRGLTGLAAIALLYPGVRHPLMLLDESHLPLLLRIRTPTLMSWLHRPDAYLHGDGSTVEVCFPGYAEGQVAYDEPEVLETATAVTFTAAGRVREGVEMVHDVEAPRWTTLSLSQPLDSRFLIGASRHPLIVVPRTDVQDSDPRRLRERPSKTRPR